MVVPAFEQTVTNFLRLAIERLRFDSRVFFAVYVLLGLPYLLLTGPFRAPDERNHFLRSYEISEFRFYPFRVSNRTVGDRLPASLSRLSEALGIHSDHRIDASQMVAARSLQLEPQQREFVEFSTAVYAPLAYAPSAISIAVGRLFGAGPLALVSIARWGNLLVGSWLIARALSSAGYARLPALLVAAFPMTVSQVATVTADAISFGLAFLWISLVLETAVATGEITLKRKLALVLLAIGLSQLRPPYPFLGLLVLVVPAGKLGRMGVLFLCGVIAASLLPAWVWNAAAAGLYEKARTAEHVAPREQLQWMVQHPGPFLHRIRRDVLTNAFNYWDQLVGRLGWLNISLPAWVPLGFAGALILATPFGRKESPQPLWWQRAALGVVVVLGVMAIEITLFVTFNTVGSPWILGVQGRYFTVLAFLAVFACSGSLVDYARLRIPILTACLLFVLAAHGAAWLALARAAGKL